uniref:Uncharacterized protein n=1 Tax=Rhizophora mucronata TaxID=61149 RepID=A0A2P2Q481_RHIMU
MASLSLSCMSHIFSRTASISSTSISHFTTRRRAGHSKVRESKGKRGNAGEIRGGKPK